MDNIILTSEMRVGSRWVHYLLAELLSKSVSPELDIGALYDTKINHVFGRLNNNAIVKFHGASFWGIEAATKRFNPKIISITRNPRDRGVSLAFHNRYHSTHNFKQKNFSTDQEAVKYTIMSDGGYWRGNIRQFSNMVPSCYVSNHTSDLNYVWIDYDDLLKNTFENIKKICSILEISATDARIRYIVNKHSFENSARRKQGDENRKDLWHRKGISNDWMNWFDDEMIEHTEEQHNLYKDYLGLIYGN